MICYVSARIIHPPQPLYHWHLNEASELNDDCINQAFILPFQPPPPQAFIIKSWCLYFLQPGLLDSFLTLVPRRSLFLSQEMRKCWYTPMVISQDTQFTNNCINWYTVSLIFISLYGSSMYACQCYISPAWMLWMPSPSFPQYNCAGLSILQEWIDECANDISCLFQAPTPQGF